MAPSHYLLQMSAEQQALQHLNVIFTLIKETLQEAQKNREHSRELSNTENKALLDITSKLKQVRSNLNNYLKAFRVQTSLDQFDQNTDE